MKAYNDVIDFWNTGGGHTPEDYLMEYTANRSKRLVEFMGRLVGNDAKILEIGCNCGRNLKYLYDAGFKNLTGIDIEGYTIAVMKQEFPDMYDNITTIVSPVESIIDTFEDSSFDAVICMGVLMHIHPDVFSKTITGIRRITKKNLLTFECEKRDAASPWCIDRNYKDIFEALGFKQIEECSESFMRIVFGSAEYFGRIFKRK